MTVILYTIPGMVCKNMYMEMNGRAKCAHNKEHDILHIITGHSRGL